jgi:hypothetical protein
MKYRQSITHPNFRKRPARRICIKHCPWTQQRKQLLCNLARSPRAWREGASCKSAFPLSSVFLSNLLPVRSVHKPVWSSPGPSVAQQPHAFPCARMTDKGHPKYRSHCRSQLLPSARKQFYWCKTVQLNRTRKTDFQ